MNSIKLDDVSRESLLSELKPNVSEKLFNFFIEKGLDSVKFNEDFIRFDYIGGGSIYKTVNGPNYEILYSILIIYTRDYKFKKILNK